MSQAPTWDVQQAADAPVTPEDFATRLKEMVEDALLSSHSGAARPSYAIEGTPWYDTDTDDLKVYDGTSDFRLTQLRDSVPSSASDTGKAGQIAFDGSHIYLCTATDTWVRATVATW